ncbi:cytochrome c oxidase subunit 3 [Polaribacter sp. Hel1_33_78]|jgi:cytochrome c oxidase subunit 3|uniref:cytochrome c oxidase subunit 3 n=1 Tax=unclassified Polaribacter TaxID=196858 RepID=UPI00087AC35B|nr:MULTISPECIES: cytochrome c oxidase subunit 3 [unclassified Polaribacter]MBT3742703.1 cytochrome oxidase subunit III [Polaribacter sp.]MBT7817002.1 cytochrome oxidase subunit III [Polaribacter sp.]MDG1402649.1 cytochrome c oxidase subunit 3 [Polaribacter sp.]MDG2436237.1 cytochrome c oxidase subunit 3 [Polaribacter sp.]SDT91527.1 cytochrome c oxidase subunit 3 [Polaribacter sp. Hel1_33_78]
MEANIAIPSDSKKTWNGGGVKPFGASYGKMMMWFFIVSDALTFSGFLAAYGLTRFKFIDSWPIADEVFTHVPFIHGNYPMYYVAFMTFILIFSSVTMVMAVDAGHKMQKNKVAWYMFATIIGGLIFVGSQAWEWNTFIKGSYGAVKTADGRLLQFVKDGHQIALSDFVVGDRMDHRESNTKKNGLWFESGESVGAYSVAQIMASYKADPSIQIRSEQIDLEKKQKIIFSREKGASELAKGKLVVEGANLKVNEYGNTIFADFFFFITGFHGFHVFSGIVINIIIFFNVILGTYEKRGHYEMVEKVGLYWHFVDLVWVFVFTFFYLV